MAAPTPLRSAVTGHAADGVRRPASCSVAFGNLHLNTGIASLRFGDCLSPRFRLRHPPVGLPPSSAAGAAGSAARGDPRRAVGSLGNEALDVDGRRAACSRREATTGHYGPHGERLPARRPACVRPGVDPAAAHAVFGATGLRRSGPRIGAYLGYRVTVCDDRSVFATVAAFPKRRGRYASDRTAICPAPSAGQGRRPHRRLRGHPKPGVRRAPAPGGATLLCGLRRAMASRRTQDDGMGKLREVGIDDGAVSGVHSPIGLDPSAHTPRRPPCPSPRGSCARAGAAAAAR